MSVIDGEVEKLAGGMTFTEGPVWLKDHDRLLFTDIPSNTILSWNGDLVPWVTNAHFAIGLSRDTSGRVLACEHSTRTLSAIDVTATGAAGRREVLAQSYRGAVLSRMPGRRDL